MRNLVLLIVATLVAGIIAYVVNTTASKAPTEQAQQVSNEVRVLSATTDIQPGTFINPELHLGWKPVQKDAVQQGYVLEGAEPIQKYAGSVARKKIFAGEIIMPDMLVKTSEGGFMAAVLSPGMRAVTVSVSAITGNAGFVFPGDKVEVVLTKTASENTPALSEVLIKAAKVLAVDQKYTSGTTAEVARTVTLEVTPEEAKSIALASDLGKISLMLISVNKSETEKSAEENSGEEQTGNTEQPTEQGVKTRSVSITKGITTTSKDFFEKE